MTPAAPQPDRRPVVLVLYPYFTPAYQAGGVVRSLQNMVTLLGDDIRFRIICGEDDLGGAPLPTGTIRGVWEEGKADVLRLKSRGAYRDIARALRRESPDLWYLNGLFRTDFGLWPLVLRAMRVVGRPPVLVATRGVFSRGALRVGRRKKRAYVGFLRTAGLLRGVSFHASTEAEQADILTHVPDGRVLVAPNPVLPPVERTVARGIRNGPLRLIFMSRISPKKNLLGAIQALRLVDRAIHLSIAGPVDDARYWHRCRNEIDALGPNVHVENLGFVHPDDMRTTLLAHDALFLPTHGENFGHAIYEALACGLPVLIGDDTPWADVGESGAGDVRPSDDVPGFAAVLRRWSKLDRADWTAMAEAALARAWRFFEESRLREQYRALFRRAMDTGAP